MGKKRRGARIYREQTDWLLVEHMVFEGKRGSLYALMDAMQCGKMARMLNERGYGISSRTEGDAILVEIPKLFALFDIKVGAEYPYDGLQGLCDVLVGLCVREGWEPDDVMKYGRPAD